MTEVKIPFTKIEAKRYSGSDKPANKEELSLKIVSTFNFNQVYEKVPPNSSPVHMRLSFVDGAETAIYNELLDDNKVSFELSFEKEKVEFYVIGQDDRDVDESKPIIDYIPFDNKDRITIHFESKFSGVIKITSIPNLVRIARIHPPPNNDYTEQIKLLSAKIAELEAKNNPNQSVQAELARLKKELLELKRKQKEKEKQPGQNPPTDNFPYGLVIGGGVVIGILLLLVIVLVVKVKKGKK